MTALFDKDCTLIGWMDSAKTHIFDIDMTWVAYIKNGHLWSSNTGNWCGPLKGLNVLDTSGKVAFWNPSDRVQGSTRPARPARAARPTRPSRPARPVRPSRPARPANPTGGWSDLDLIGLINQ